MSNIVKGVGAVAVTFGLVLVNMVPHVIGYPLITFGLCLLTFNQKD